MKRIGLLGGRFDPVYVAHIALARSALQALDLAEVQLIPAANPWQRAALHATAQQRRDMLELAIDGAATKLDHALEHLFGKLQGKPRAAAKNVPANKVNDDALEEEFLENENAAINS